MKRSLQTRPLAAVFLLAALTACSAAPFRVAGSDDTVSEARAEGAKTLPRLRPYAFGMCYSPMVNEDPEIDEEAAYECEGGRLVRKDEDFFWNDCSLSQPHRVNFICFPPDKAKPRPTAQSQ